MRIALVFLLFPLVTRAAPVPDPALLAAAAEADLRLRANGDCAEKDLAAIHAALAALHAASDPTSHTPAPWVFPIANVDIASSIGGKNGSGFLVARGAHCYAASNIGHPAHDLFVADPDQNSLDSKENPFSALAVDDGLVLIAHTGWKPGDALKGGNFVMLYLPRLDAIAYYAHLATIAVAPGQRVTAGDLVGTIGRTGRNAFPKRSPTHLHFALWDANRLMPRNPFDALLHARRHP